MSEMDRHRHPRPDRRFQILLALLLCTKLRSHHNNHQRPLHRQSFLQIHGLSSFEISRGLYQRSRRPNKRQTPRRVVQRNSPEQAPNCGALRSRQVLLLKQMKLKKLSMAKLLGQPGQQHRMLRRWISTTTFLLQVFRRRSQAEDQAVAAIPIWLLRPYQMHLRSRSPSLRAQNPVLLYSTSTIFATPYHLPIQPVEASRT